MKGQHQKDRKRPTKAEQEERTELTIKLLATGTRKHLIKQMLNKAYGLVGRSAERYLSRARERMMKEAGTTKEMMRADAYAFYSQVIASTDKSITPRDKHAARTRIDEMFALDNPKLMHIATPKGGKVELEVKHKGEFDFNEYARLQRDVLGLPDTNGSGQPVHPAHSDPEAGPVSHSNGH